MDREDRLEDRISLLKFQLKELQDEVDELRRVMNGLAHAVALLQPKKGTPLWVQEYYRKWEGKQKSWWNLD
jgi:hypothetical protein